MQVWNHMIYDTLQNNPSGRCYVFSSTEKVLVHMMLLVLEYQFVKFPYSILI